MTVEKCVQTGIDWLDTQMDREDWLAKIDIDQLCITHTYACPAGQVFGNWFNVVTRLGNSGVIACGFDAPNDPQQLATETVQAAAERSYAELEAEWVKRLKELKGTTDAD